MKRIALVIIVAIWMSSAGLAKADAPCPPGNGMLNLWAPSGVVYDRPATVFVTTNENLGLYMVESASLVISNQATGQAFYSYTFTPDDLDNLNGSVASSWAKRLPIELTSGAGPAQVVLTYTQGYEPGEGDCSAQAARTVAPTAPRVPHLTVDDGDYGHHGVTSLHFEARGGCAYEKSVPIVITLKGRTSEKLWTHDACKQNSWWQQGQARGVKASNDVSTSGSTIFLTPGNVPKYRTFNYRFSTSIAGRVVRHGWLTALYEHIGAQRVYQGTDGFVNYCIDQNKTIYSSHLRLYCVRPGWTLHFVSLDPVWRKH